MEKNRNSKTKSGKKRRWILMLSPAFIVLVIALIIIIIPLYLSSENGRRMIIARVNNAIDGKMDFTDLSVGWFKGIKVEDFSFNDEAGEISVRAAEISTEPHYGSIIKGNMSFGQTTIDKPRIEINIKDLKDKKITSTSEPKSVSVKSKNIALAMDLNVKDGSFKITDPKLKSVEVTQINSKVSLRPLGQKSSFEMFMAIEGTGKPATLQANGQVKTAKTGWSLKGTTGDLAVEVNDLDLGSLEAFLALAGVEIQAGGIVNGNMKGQIINGKIDNLDTGINAKDLDISGAVLKGDRIRTNNLDINAKLNQKNELINIDNLQVKSDWASVTAGGSVPTSFGSFSDLLKSDSGYNIKGTFDCDLPAVMSQLPNTLKMQEGTTITSGRLNGNIDTVTQSGSKKIQAHATLSVLEGIVEQKKIAMSEPVTAEALISSDQTGIKFDKADLSAPFAKINCSGTTEQIRFNADADLGKLQAELGQFVDIGPYQMVGRFQGTGNVSILPDKITTTGSTQISNLKLTDANDLSVSEPKANVNFAVEINSKENTVVANSITAETSFGRIDVKDAVVPMNKQAAKSMNLTASITGFDLAKIRPFAVMFASFPQQMQLEGVATSQVSVSSKGDVYAISTDSTSIKNLKMTYPEKKPFEEKEVLLTFATEYNTQDKSTNIKKLQLRSSHINATLSELKQITKDDKTKLEGQAELEYDWAAVSTAAAPYLPEGLSLEGKRKDTITFASEYPAGQSDKLMANLNAAGKVGFEKADYMGLNFGTTEVDIQVEKGLLKVAPFMTTVNEGKINFAANVDFKEASPAFTTPQPVSIQGVQINESVAGNLLKYVNPIFANAVGAKGVANFSAEKIVIPLSKADKNKIQVVGAVGIDDMQLRPTGLIGQIFSLMKVSDPRALMKLHSTNFTLQNGFVRYDNMQVDIGDNPVNFRGTIGLDKSLDMGVTLPYTFGGRTVRTGSQSSGRITLPLTNTIDNPKLDTSKLLESQGLNIIKDILENL